MFVTPGALQATLCCAMSEPAVCVATYEDVLAAPENKIAEIVHGVLHLSPRPAGPHAIAGSRLGVELGAPFDRGRGGPGGWIIVDEPELHLGGDILVPDLAGWRRERMPRFPNAAFVTVAPDWVCEVLSPRTHAFDRVEKKSIYARESVQYLWFVDPLEQTLETYELNNRRWVDIGSFSGDAMVRGVPFDAVALDLGSLWADVEPPLGR